MRQLGTLVVRLGLAALFMVQIACRPTGPSPSPIAPPPTFVLAWVGSGGNVRTVESTDGVIWRHEVVQATVITNSRDRGPALAHDGRLVWMLMWVNGPELEYKVGVGGTTVSTPITWEAQPSVGRLQVFPSSAPALAFANGRWLAAWRNAGGALMVARSSVSGPTNWEPAVALTHGIRRIPALLTRAPALTSTTINGARVFVVAYRGNDGSAIVATSPDGLAWSEPVTVDATEKEPALTEMNGRIYLLLSRPIGLGFTNFIYKSSDALNWQQIASHSGAPLNATGPALAVSPWKAIVAEQIGGALGGTFVGISLRNGSPVSPTNDPPAYEFGDHRQLTAPAGSLPSVGNAGARTAILFTSPSAQPLAVTDVDVTQSGIIDPSVPTRALVAGKTTLVRVTVRARSGQIDDARLSLFDRSQGRTRVTVQGFAYAADNITLMPSIPSDSAIHFFVPGAELGDAGVRFDLLVTSGSDTLELLGVVDEARARQNPGIPIMVTGFDQSPPRNATVAAELQQVARTFPVADGVGAFGSANGVRFSYVSNIALPAQGSLGSYVDEFVLSNMMVGAGNNSAGNPCAANVPSQFFTGRFFPTNFSGPEDLDRNGVFSADEVARCTGPGAPIGQRFANFIARLNSETQTRWDAVSGSDVPKIGAAVMTFGNPGGQNRTGLAGQCPQGLGSNRLCWSSVGLNALVLQHEMGHAMGLCHADDPPANCPTATSAAGQLGYDLLNRVRVPNPQRLMTGNVPGGVSFFTIPEYEQVRAAVNSQAYATLARLEASPLVPAARPFGAAARAAQDVRTLVLAGTWSPQGGLQVLSTRVVTGTAAKLSAGDDVTVRQFDAAGAELVRASFALPRPPTDQLAVPDSLAPPLAFMARVPFDERARAIVLAGAGRTLRRIEVSPRAPTVRLLGMPSFERDTARIAWAGSDPDGDRVTYDVLLAYPGSARTVVLASGVRGTEALVPTRWLPGGEGATLRVEASDGFRVAAAEHAGLSIPDHAPEVTVAYPAAGAAFRSGGRVTLRAIALDPEEGTLSGDRVHWTSDVQGALGTGDDLLVALKAGTHLIRVDAIDARGARAEATVRVVVRD